MLSRYIIPCLALLGSLPAAATTVSSDGAPTRVVAFGDLNLNSDAGISRLYARIKSAAKEVCQPQELWSPYVYVPHGCQEHAIEQAVADVQSAKLKTLHLSLTNQPQRESSR